jgi:hypothetical protein
MMEQEAIQELPSDEYLHGTVKQLRRDVDACIQDAQRQQVLFFHRSGSDEIKLAIDKLREGKMWLGQVLGALGYKLPEEYRDEAEGQ